MVVREAWRADIKCDRCKLAAYAYGCARDETDGVCAYIEVAARLRELVAARGWLVARDPAGLASCMGDDIDMCPACAADICEVTGLHFCQEVG